MDKTIKNKIETARKNTDKNPSNGEKESGNYKKGKITVNGFKISLENPKGSVRSGIDSNGREWRIKMKNDYGYFLNTVGYDGDNIDVFLGSDIDSKKIFVIDQKINGKFDESKVMLWFSTEKKAKDAYLSNYEKNWKGFDRITEIDEETFKKWLYDGKKQRKPFYEYKDIEKKVKKMKVNENILRGIIRECITNIINEDKESTKLTNKLIKNLYNVAHQYNGIFKDNSWENVHSMFDKMSEIEGVSNLSIGGGRYHGQIGSESLYKEYDVKIDTIYGTKIGGKVNCNFCGSMKDPMSCYDITVSFWKDNDKVMDESMINEGKRGLNSQKLFNIAKEHGGFNKDHARSFYLNSLTDNDVIGIIPHDILKKLNTMKNRIEYAIRMGFKVNRGDGVELIPMGDWTWVGIIERGALLNNAQYAQTKIGRIKNLRDKYRATFDGKNEYQWSDNEHQDKFNNKKEQNNLIKNNNNV